MSMLFMLFFSSECVYAVYGTFTSEYVYYVIFFSSGCVYAGLYVTFLLANMFSLFMALYYSTIMSFHQIRSRERAKYETVIHCSVPV